MKKQIDWVKVLETNKSKVEAALRTIYIQAAGGPANSDLNAVAIINQWGEIKIMTLGCGQVAGDCFDGLAYEFGRCRWYPWPKDCFDGYENPEEADADGQINYDVLDEYMCDWVEQSFKIAIQDAQQQKARHGNYRVLTNEPIIVHYLAGEGRHCMEAVDYMLADADGLKLYAEEINPTWDDVQKKFLDETATYDILKERILDMAHDQGINLDRLIFPYD